LEEVGKVIVKKCHGLPLAVKTIGGLLKSKAQSTEVWRRICHNFHDALTAKESENSVMASLQLSYDELPIRMKQCLLCFSLYPEDSEIAAEQLVHWWVGEGFIEGRNTSTTMELAFDYLSELISRCLVEVVQRRGYDGRVYSCRMHDLVRDLTIKIAREEGFCSFDDQGRQRPSARSRRLSFTNEADVRSMNKKSRIRALLMMTSSPIQFNRNIVMFTIKSLRVLDFSKNKLENICIEDLLNRISSLERLASLNLRGVSALKELPFSIGKLGNLQLLVLSGCNNLQKLPLSITALQKLILLDIGHCPIQYLPQGIGRLSNLQELSGFKLVGADNKDGCRLAELQSLLQLRVLRVNISEESEIAEEELTVLTHLKQLKVLSINSEGCDKEEIFQNLERLSPPPHLEELYLRHYRGGLTPQWINPTSLCHLQSLCMENGDIKSTSPV
jgi:hypothetical protein